MTDTSTPCDAAPMPAGQAPPPPMHRSIVHAICKVQATLDAVKKTHTNRHGGYDFASTDDIYAAVTRKLGEVGLLIYPIELEPVRETIMTVSQFDREGAKTGDKTISKLTFHFGYMLATEESTWFDPRSSRSITVLHTGPQTYNAAESYCQKAYLRALLKIPTGDLDLDALPQGDTIEDQSALVGIGTGNGKAGKRKSSYAAKKDGTADLFKEIHDKVRNAPNADVLQQVRTIYAEEWAAMPRQWLETLDQDYETRMSEFGMRDAAE